MTYIFNKESNSLIQKMDSKRPEKRDFQFYSEYATAVTLWDEANIRMKHFQAIQDDRWIDKKEYEEGKDFEIVEQMEHISKYIKYARLKPNQSESRGKIICAAIWFKDGEIHEHQPKNIDTGFVVAGRRHHNCFRTVNILLKGEIPKWNERAVQGFITTKDRFVDRKEAGIIAYEAKQISEQNNCLFSEDLY